MSYRIGDRVYWTKKKIALAEGETVLTDGVTTIRARCGNLVSDQAMSPTSAEEPPASAFDSVEPRGLSAAASPSQGSGPLVGVGGGGALVSPSSNASVPNQNASTGVGGNSGSIGGPGGGFGSGLAPQRPSDGQSTDSSLTDEPGVPGTDGPNGDNPPPATPPGDGNPPEDNPPGDNPPGFENPPGITPPDFNPPGFGENPPPGSGTGNPGITPENPPIDTTPPETVPVPEPASLVLFGSGLALTAWRARRKHAKKSDS
jgi:hypothetical protein